MNANPSVSLVDRYISIRKRTEELTKNLQAEDFVPQPIVDVSPPKWHLGHTTWFFEAMVLRIYTKNYASYNKDFDFIFNSYYESQGPRINRSNRGNLTRPPVSEVLNYRNYVDRAIQEFLTGEQVLAEALELIELGLHHEQQHQELLLTDIKYILGTNPFFPPLIEKEVKSGQLIDQDWINVEEGIYTIGHTSGAFCYDNELPAHRVFLEPFALSNRLVTNAEYLEFIKAGGYTNFQYWLMEGWEWAKSLEIKAPLYWIESENGWQYYTLNGLKKVNLSEPVTHISYYEADAYARWKGLRLPYETEWETVASKHSSLENGNWVESEQFHPTIEINPSFFGNCWQWTQSAYLPYPGYRPVPGPAGEYNGKFMINQMVLRGGSCATSHTHIRPGYRNFFHPDKRWQFTGIRLAKTL